MLVAPARPHSGYPSRAALGIPASLFGRAGARQSGTVTARRGPWAIGPGQSAAFEASLTKGMLVGHRPALTRALPIRVSLYGFS
jgi:hypothetical protein